MKNSLFVRNFENTVCSSLEQNGVSLQNLKNSSSKIAVAVSGGADSVSLLVSLSYLCARFSVPLIAFSVNHNIREEKETKGDVLFVKDLCNNLSNNIKNLSLTFIEKEIPRGKIFSYAKEHKTGIEDAARFFRYEAFFELKNLYDPVCICLAHNKNDQIETILMRFLQGSSSKGLSGIASKRDIFVRPLIETSRAEIEQYLNELKITWRLDSTNSDEHYERNKIRKKLVPFLQENFLGYEKALLAGRKKAFYDEQFFDSFDYKKNIKTQDSKVFVDFKEFISYPNALKMRLVYALYEKFAEVCNLLAEKRRLPFSAVESSLLLKANNLKKETVFFETDCASFFYNEQKIGIKKRDFIATDSSFFAIIKESVTLEIFSCVMQVESKGSYADVKFLLPQENKNDSEIIALLTEVSFPFCVRSFSAIDKVRSADGKYVSVSGIFSSWHVEEKLKNQIPVIQDLKYSSQEILAVIGSACGFKNWIVKGTV